MTADSGGLEAEVRRAAPDLWLSSRLVGDAAARAGLIGLYAFHLELARVGAAAKTPLAGEIRLAWWREEMEALDAPGRLPGHPALADLRTAPAPVAAILQEMIEARHADLDSRPFADEGALMAYVDAVEGGLASAAGAILSPPFCGSLAQTGRVVGLSRLLTSRDAWRAQSRDWAPVTWGDAADDEIRAHMLRRISESREGMHAEIRALPVRAFPAVAHATLAKIYTRGGRPSELEKRIRLLWATLRGNV